LEVVAAARRSCLQPPTSPPSVTRRDLSANANRL